MTGAVRDEIIRMLANDALEGAEKVTDPRKVGGEAAMMLVEAMMSLLVTRVGPVNAHEAAGMYVGYIMRTSDAVLAAHQRGELQ